MHDSHQKQILTITGSYFITAHNIVTASVLAKKSPGHTEQVWPHFFLLVDECWSCFVLFLSDVLLKLVFGIIWLLFVIYSESWCKTF